ncbi:MAG: 2-succinyl-5-enolpyruvyl-6-hydroxy-3-cyclohexene-1-carboxylic-acid synthase [Acidobacteriota bacterium]
MPHQPLDLQAQWARLILTTFADAGVREVVVSPGSRSTPFVVAAVAEKRLTLHDVVDERAAGFFALGQARRSGLPSLLLCTSGTAAAHYLPAVIEAGMTGVPMLILSADRPLELLDCGANQTIDQSHLFGGQARAFVDLGTAEPAPAALRGVRRRIAQAVFTAHGPTPGAVHLNARARKPLEPPPDDGPRAGAVVHVDRLLARPLVRASHPVSAPPGTALGELVVACRTVERGLIVAGPGSVGQGAVRRTVAELCHFTGYPLLADLASQLRGTGAPAVDSLEALLRSDLWDDLRPDLILQIGRAPTTTAWVRRIAERFESDDPIGAHWVLGPHDWHDPESTATHLLRADLDVALGTVAMAMATAPPAQERSEWTARWRQVADRVRGAVESTLDGPEFTEGQVAREAVGAVPATGNLVLGNSLAIRHADLFGGQTRTGVRVLSQRGASGIDGLVAGAAGAASAGHPTLLLLGDVSLRHDLGGLLTAGRGGSPFVVVMINNGGGRIFELLPIANTVDDGTFRHWLTPPDDGVGDAADIARVGGFSFRRVDRRSHLREALVHALTAGGPWLIEAAVPPSGAIDERRRLDDALAAHPENPSPETTPP